MTPTPTGLDARLRALMRRAASSEAGGPLPERCRTPAGEDGAARRARQVAERRPLCGRRAGYLFAHTR